MSPSTPSAANCTATMNSVEPRISDWMWPSPSPSTKNQTKRAQMTAPTSRRDGRGDHEQPQRLVERVDAEDRDPVAADVRPHRREQARLARLRVGPDRDVVDGDQHLARLDDRLERVGELGDDLDLDRRLAVVGAEARGGVGDAGVGRAPHDRAAPALEQLLGGREVLDLVGLAVADDHVGVPLEDRRHQLRDVGADVLVVGVGVDDDVGAELEAGVEARLEAGGEPAVVGEAHDVVDAARARDLDGAVGRAVVDDEPLDLVDAGDRARQVARASRAASPPR